MVKLAERAQLLMPQKLSAATCDRYRRCSSVGSKTWTLPLSNSGRPMTCARRRGRFAIAATPLVWAALVTTGIHLGNRQYQRGPYDDFHPDGAAIIPSNFGWAAVQQRRPK